MEQIRALVGEQAEVDQSARRSRWFSRGRQPPSPSPPRSPVPAHLSPYTSRRPAQVPLSFTQQRLWLQDRLAQASAIAARCSENACVRVAGALDEQRMLQAIVKVIERHEVLRTTFPEGDSGPFQDVAAPEESVKHVDFCVGPEVDAVQLESQLVKASQQPFDLERGPLLRCRVFPLSGAEKDEMAVFWSVHHIVADAWSLRMLLHELSEVYNKNDGIDTCAERAPLQYADYTLWQQEWLQGEMLEWQLEYWRNELTGVPEAVALPIDVPRRAVKERTYDASWLRFRLPESLLRGLQQVATDSATPLSVVLLTGLQLLLRQYAHNSDEEAVVVGTALPNRNHRGSDTVMGSFENMVVIKFSASSKMSIAEALYQVSNKVLSAREVEELPFEQLVDHMNLERRPELHPLFQVACVLGDWNSCLSSPLHIDGMRITSPLRCVSSVAQNDLTLHVEEGGEQVAFEYARDIFQEATVKRIADHYLSLLGCIASKAVDGTTTDCDMQCNFLTAQEHLHFQQWNETNQDFGLVNKPVHALVEAQVALHPTGIAVALAGGCGSLTYAQLDVAANKLAHYLIDSCGLKPDTLVPVIAERSLEMIIAVYGLEKAGAAYVPIDPELPEDRIAGILADVQPQVILASCDRLAKRLPRLESAVTVLSLKEHRDLWESPSLSETSPAVPLTGTNSAYAIFTSGSTGKPKAVVCIHQGLVNYLTWMRTRFSVDEHDRVLQTTNFCFDPSVWQLFLPLISGACLVVAPPGAHKDPEALVDLMQKEAITVVDSVPTMLKQWAAAEGFSKTAMRLVFCGGEAMPLSLCKLFYEKLGSQSTLVNVYGPTESSIAVTYYECKPDTARYLKDTHHSSSVPIGQPISNAQLHILSGDLKPMPVGVVGELSVSGICLARGYLNRPDLTATKFVQWQPACRKEPVRLYRTGDLARYLPDGNIEFAGRIDVQVKLRGLRIELGEIECALRAHELVSEAVVMVREDVPEVKYIAAYVVLRHRSSSDDAKQIADKLKQFVARSLPHYMVPSAIVFMDTMPVTVSSGKVDMRALPAPSLQANAREYIAPRTEAEKEIAAIFGEALGLQKVGAADDFFALGGNSVLAVTVISLTRRRLCPLIKYQDVFRNPTVEGLAAFLTQKEQQDPTSRQTAATNILKLLENDCLLDPAITAAAWDRECPPKEDILVTGATGFIGSHVLLQLVCSTKAEIHCIVRGGETALQAKLRSLNLWDPALRRRVHTYQGDLARPSLGLGEQVWCDLVRRVGLIFHAGAKVNHVEPYSTHRDANVLGTVEVLRLAAAARAGVVFASSLSVLGDSVSHLQTLEEISAASGYAQSKWVADALVLEAMHRGIPVALARVAMVSWSTTSGVANMSDHLNLLVEGSRILGCVPATAASSKWPLVPVDFVARTLIRLSTQIGPHKGRAVAVSNARLLQFTQLLQYVSQASRTREYTDAAQKIVPDNTWLIRLRERISELQQRSCSAAELQTLLSLLLLTDISITNHAPAPCTVEHHVEESQQQQPQEPQAGDDLVLYPPIRREAVLPYAKFLAHLHSNKAPACHAVATPQN
eukprot:TRINITY_DN18345_c0_g1_i1.p1 TRINITY_DN18345_c0_g1~~TRINITY_DN18345_c0_g1_i1.p1  ORF type:complete len:1563 (-),score=330.98 TRINITY_DN18345_c0_g1_i1:94-4782(-)